MGSDGYSEPIPKDTDPLGKQSIYTGSERDALSFDASG
jgi:hypothetical protein